MSTELCSLGLSSLLHPERLYLSPFTCKEKNPAVLVYFGVIGNLVWLALYVLGSKPSAWHTGSKCLPLGHMHQPQGCSKHGPRLWLICCMADFHFQTAFHYLKICFICIYSKCLFPFLTWHATSHFNLETLLLICSVVPLGSIRSGIPVFDFEHTMNIGVDKRLRPHGRG